MLTYTKEHLKNLKDSCVIRNREENAENET